MAIRFCYASISETGTVNGVAGDQTGNEVKIANEYNFGQCWIIRCNKKTKRLRIASAARRIVKNDNVGYSQNTRSGIFSQSRALKWLIRKISKLPKCNCDCSTMGCASVNYAYNQELVPQLTTATMPGWFEEKSDFEVIKKSNLKGVKLLKGDLVGKSGHVVVVYKGGTSKY